MVLPKDDGDLKKMDSSARARFVNFVLPRYDVCVYKEDGNTSCELLRQMVDNNKEIAGTIGINFDAKMKSIGKKLGRFFNAHDADTVTPYGILTLLQWALEFGRDHNPRAFGMPRPIDLNKMIRFIVVHKDELWDEIKGGIALGKESRPDHSPDVEPLVQYIFDNYYEMGWQMPAVPSVQSLRTTMQFLADHFDLMRTSSRSWF